MKIKYNEPNKPAPPVPADIPPIALESKLLTKPMIVSIPKSYPIPTKETPIKQRMIFFYSKFTETITKIVPETAIIIVIIILVKCLILTKAFP